MYTARTGCHANCKCKTCDIDRTVTVCCLSTAHYEIGLSCPKTSCEDYVCSKCVDFQPENDGSYPLCDNPVCERRAVCLVSARRINEVEN